MGGSIGSADPSLGLPMGYSMNRMGPGVLLNERGHASSTRPMRRRRSFDGDERLDRPDAALQPQAVCGNSARISVIDISSTSRTDLRALSASG